MALRKTALPVAPSTRTPSWPLKAIRLPRMMLSDVPLKIHTPLPPLPSGCVPVTSVPIRFPSMRAPVAAAPKIGTPLSRLPEMTLPAPASGPPIVTSAAPTATPW